jgi:hypothetical protein
VWRPIATKVEVEVGESTAWEVVDFALAVEANEAQHLKMSILSRCHDLNKLTQVGDICMF